MNASLIILLLMAVTAGFTAAYICRAVFRNREPQRSWQRHDLLTVEALNRVDLCVIIYDAQFRPVHWNDATETTFPALVPLLKRGTTLPDLIAQSYRIGVTYDILPDDEAQNLSRTILDALREHRDTTRVVKMADGRVFEAVEFALSSGHFASVRKDVTTVHSLSEKVSHQSRQLTINHERLKHFSATAAHDLRAPLLQQMGLIAAWEEDAKDAGLCMSSEMLEHVSLCKSSAIRMLRLVEDLLEYARCEEIEDQVEAVSLSARVDEILPLVSVPDGFEIRFPADLPSIKVPEAACDIVLRNLITNAIHHHDRKEGVIRISAETSGARVLVRVQDDGPGIPDPYKLSVFAPFERLELGASRRGSGLGLAMVARTIESWGGTIAVRDAPERGSIFEFSAPLAESPGASPSLSAA